MSIELISPIYFHTVVNKLRQFFIERGFIEMHTQNRLSILSACEDPNTVSTFNYAKQVWPLPQTGQMWLEYELLKNPRLKKIFCVSTSYRNEPNPIAGRHDLIFPMFEFEMNGNIDDLIALESDLVRFLGYIKKDIKKYCDICQKYKTDIIEHKHEQNLYEDYGPVVFLTDFPDYTHPFWNMKMDDKIAKKVDVILSGMETIGSAERSCDPDLMRKKFHEINNGDYAAKLYSLFGKERVNNELNEFLNNRFIVRSGGGIGITRLIKSMIKEHLL